MIKVALIIGGKSAEHEVSIMTSREIIKAIDKERFEVTIFAIDKKGNWNQIDFLSDDVKSFEDFGSEVHISGEIFEKLQTDMDVAFLLLHGPYGEDGRIQGLFDMIGKPYVGANLLSSAMCMDKAITKVVLENAGINQTKYKVLSKYEQVDMEMLKLYFKLPVFIKPANMGSSVGISKVKQWDEFEKFASLAHEYDSKIIVEQGIDARELECAVLGNDKLVVSRVGEIIPSHEFYDYEAKYFDGGASRMVIPADIDKEAMETIRQMAKEAYRALDVEGMCRIDFFMDKGNGEIFLNELNTIPGFTPFSMYPNLIMDQGMTYSEILERLIELALERKASEQ